MTRSFYFPTAEFYRSKNSLFNNHIMLEPKKNVFAISVFMVDTVALCGEKNATKNYIFLAYFQGMEGN